VRKSYGELLCGNIIWTHEGAFWDAFVGAALSTGLLITLLIETDCHGQVYGVTAWAPPPQVKKAKRGKGNPRFAHC
jgi:hypothetical protein